MNTKVLVGGLIGGIVYFLLGWLLYGMLLADTMSGYINAACMRPMEEMNMGLMVVGNLGFGFLLAYVLSNGTGFSNVSGGAVAGAIVGLLVSLSFDCMIHAQSTMMNSFTGIIIDVAVFTIMSGAAGGAVGWWLGRGSGARGTHSPA